MTRDNIYAQLRALGEVGALEDMLFSYLPGEGALEDKIFQLDPTVGGVENWCASITELSSEEESIIDEFGAEITDEFGESLWE